MAGMSNAGTPTLSRLPKPAVEPQSVESDSVSLLEARLTPDELGDEKRVANEFIDGTRVC